MVWIPLATVTVRALTATLGHGLELSNCTLAHLAEVMDPAAIALPALLCSFGNAGLTAQIGAGVALILAACLFPAAQPLPPVAP